MPERRTVTYSNIAVCPDGHAVPLKGTERQVVEYRNSCRHWVAEDANYCGTCGKMTDEVAKLDVVLMPSHIIHEEGI